MPPPTTANRAKYFLPLHFMLLFVFVFINQRELIVVENPNHISIIIITELLGFFVYMSAFYRFNSKESLRQFFQSFKRPHLFFVGLMSIFIVYIVRDYIASLLMQETLEIGFRKFVIKDTWGVFLQFLATLLPLVILEEITNRSLFLEWFSGKPKSYLFYILFSFIFVLLHSFRIFHKFSDYGFPLLIMALIWLYLYLIFKSIWLNVGIHAGSNFFVDSIQVKHLESNYETNSIINKIFLVLILIGVMYYYYRYYTKKQEVLAQA